MNAHQDHGLLKADEVAKKLGLLDPRTIARYAREGKLEQVRLSARCFRYTASSVEALMKPTEEPRP